MAMTAAKSGKSRRMKNGAPRRASTMDRAAPGPCGRSPGIKSDGFLELLCGAEGYLLACLDLDRRAGCRVAAHAGGALAHLQDAEAADADPIALLQVLGDEADEIAEDRLGLLLRHLVIFRQLRCQVSQRDGELLYRCCCLGHGPYLLDAGDWETASLRTPA